VVHVLEGAVRPNRGTSFTCAQEEALQHLQDANMRFKEAESDHQLLNDKLKLYTDDDFNVEVCTKH
jgi:hypothetical protein